MFFSTQIRRQKVLIYLSIVIIALSVTFVFNGCVTRTDIFDTHFAPELIIRQGSDSIADGESVINFGYVGLYNTTPLTFTIENTGHGPLKIMSISSISIPTPQFNIDVSAMSSNLDAGSNTVFTVAFKPTSLGYQSATIMLINNGTDKPFTFTVEGYGESSSIAPDITLKQGSTDIPNGSGNYDFGNITVGGSSSPVTFTMSNNGNADLGVINVLPINGDTGQFDIIAPSLPLSLSPLESTTFTIGFLPTFSGSMYAEVQIVNDDPDESPYIFSVTGYGEPLPEPEIEVKQGSTYLPDGTGSYDFGNIQVFTSSSPVNFTMKNIGSADLTIYDIWSNSGDFVVNKPGMPVTVVSGSNKTFSVTFEPSFVGSNSATITIDNDDLNENPYTFSVIGYGNPPPAPDINIMQGSTNMPDGTGSYDFGNIEATTSSAPVIFTLENTGNADLYVADIYSSSSDFLVNKPLTPLFLLAGTSTTFEVSFAPSVVGNYSETITIDNDDSDESPYTFSVLGYGSPLPEPDIHVKQGLTDMPHGTGLYDYGHFVTGSPSSPVTFTIENNGTGDLTINDIVASSSDFTINKPAVPFTITVGSSSTFDIIFNPSTVGLITANIDIDNNDPDENPYIFSVQGYGDATATPDIKIPDVEPSMVYDFGNKDVGDNKIHQFDMENKGSGDLLITSISLTIGDTSQFTIDMSTMSSIVIPGDKTKFSIKFLPTITGSILATVTIDTNDPDESLYNFDVKGYGDPVPIEDIHLKEGSTDIPDGGSFDFGAVSGSSTKQFTIENVGTDDLQITNILLQDGDSDYALDLGGTIFLLTPGASTTFKVTFTPSGTGTKFTNLVINNSDPDETPYNVTLLGYLL
jgi:hypothetical protein